MAQYKINDTTLTNIADAIRSKTGEFTKIAEVPMDAPAVYDITLATNEVIDNKLDMPIINNVGRVVIVIKPTGIGETVTTTWAVFNQSTRLADLLMNSRKWQTHTVDKTFDGETVKLRFASGATGGYKINITVEYYDVSGNLITTQEAEVLNTMTPEQMADEINGIEIPEEIPEEAFTLTGNCDYRFANGNWNWFINQYGNKITTQNITGGYYMFYNNGTIEEIPFDINFNGSPSNNMFQFCGKLKKLPKMTGQLGAGKNLFRHCYNLIIEEDAVKDLDLSLINTNQYNALDGIFYECYSLRVVPDCLISQLYSKATSSSYSPMNATFYGCASLDEVLNFPIMTPTSANTSNIISNFVGYCFRLKNLTFATQEDGTPFTWNAKSQLLSLDTYLGYAMSLNTSRITDYNSGITADKKVIDDASYQALKNDPDWFSEKIEYSRYNHDSAVATINSLPDTSAYLATAGGTNTIKFKGASGSATDAGAINTLTEEEIAVATAKGWTVTFA